MRIVATVFSLLFILVFAQAQDQSNIKYSRAKIYFAPEDILKLAALGLDTDHGEHHHVKDPFEQEQSFVVSDFADYELEAVRNAGFEYDVIIDDVKEHYVNQNVGATLEIDRETASLRNPPENCGDVSLFKIPDNFVLGSMGGYYTYEEMLNILDQMYSLYPNLITEKAPINDSLTHEGRPIYWLKISDNPNIDEDEPEVFYNSLTHAREPNSLTQNIYYMWYLLENYSTNKEIKYLVDNSEMYFVPCINPDGYVFNQLNDPNGGGLWRKNRRDNGDGTFGVDLNRNYGFQWGFDDFGSSGSTFSQVYRGPAPFSEPESQMIRQFCNAHEFKIALNCHTYSNLLLYPFSYSDSNAEPETFYPLAEVMTRGNKYAPGWGTAVLGYAVNGDVVDWQYGEQSEKPKTYGFVPEVGPPDYGFWPPQSEIVRVTQTALLQDIYAAHLVLHYVELSEESDDLVAATRNEVSFNLQRYGLKDGSITISLEALSDNVASVDPPIIISLNEFEGMDGTIGYDLADGILDGQKFTLKLKWSNGQHTWSKTLDKYFGVKEVVVSSDLNSFDGWVTPGLSQWGLTSEQFVTPPFSMTDSPSSDYSSSALSWVELTDTIDLTEAGAAILKFWARWELEPARDYVQVEARRMSDMEFQPLCGKYTVPGAATQEEGEPLYDEYQTEWVLEEMDLAEYIGDKIFIRFKFQSNGGFFTDDGFYFDDLVVEKVFEEIVSSSFPDEELFKLKQNQPNPADDYTNINFSNNLSPDVEILIFDGLGQLVLQNTIGVVNSGSVLIYTKNWEQGVYFYQIKDGNTTSKALKMTVHH